MAAESRFTLTEQIDPEHYQELVAAAGARIERRLALYRELAEAARRSRPEAPP